LACQGCPYHQPTVEELTEFIGKTEEDVHNKYGTPTSTGHIDSCIYALDATETEIEEFWEQTAQRTLYYGGVRVDINTHGRIIEVYRSP
jgi:hypothetical protein